MSASVRLSGKLPGDREINGLDDLADQLSDETADDIFIAVAWFDVSDINLDKDSHTRRPTVRIRRIEPLGTLGSAPSVVLDAAIEAGQQRLGRTPLPFDVVETVDGGYVEPGVDE